MLFCCFVCCCRGFAPSWCVCAFWFLFRRLSLLLLVGIAVVLAARWLNGSGVHGSESLATTDRAG